MQKVIISKNLAALSGAIGGGVALVGIVQSLAGALSLSLLLVLGTAFVAIFAIAGYVLAAMANAGWFSGDGGEAEGEDDDFLLNNESVNVNGLPMFGGVDSNGNPYGSTSND